eukprot:TRINITY_DN10337_c0_g2_i1.p2 TRINITY_DN10337_c0_g2~~TRINITY_DN10337_c0_g2_i1.p2  ORF type:complete len:214 (+),score=16.12 TRINITY_DN10337_c0_g2_i1:913-1554(+)
MMLGAVAIVLGVDLANLTVTRLLGIAMETAQVMVNQQLTTLEVLRPGEPNRSINPIVGAATDVILHVLMPDIARQLPLALEEEATRTSGIRDDMEVELRPQGIAATIDLRRAAHTTAQEHQEPLLVDRGMANQHQGMGSLATVAMTAVVVVVVGKVHLHKDIMDNIDEGLTASTGVRKVRQQGALNSVEGHHWASTRLTNLTNQPCKSGLCKA